MIRYLAFLLLLFAGVAFAQPAQAPLRTTQITNAAPTPLTPGITTAQMVGLGGVITPVNLTRVFVSITGTINVPSTTNGVQYACRWGTGQTPSNGQTAQGNVIGLPINYLAAASTQKSLFHCAGIITGLALNKPIWTDLSLLNTTGPVQVTLTQVTLSAYEF